MCYFFLAAAICCPRRSNSGLGRMCLSRPERQSHSHPRNAEECLILCAIRKDLGRDRGLKEGRGGGERSFDSAIIMWGCFPRGGRGRGGGASGVCRCGRLSVVLGCSFGGSGIFGVLASVARCGGFSLCSCLQRRRGGAEGRPRRLRGLAQQHRRAAVFARPPRAFFLLNDSVSFSKYLAFCISCQNGV